MLTFDLRIPGSAYTAAAIKCNVANSLPDIKSSHLSEDIARGMGFKAHASLLAVSGAGEASRYLVSGAAFSEFLSKRGYEVDEKAFYIAAARVAMRNVIEAEPRLSHWGYGIGRPKKKLDGRWESPKECRLRFLMERDQLLSDGSVEEFLRSLVLVQLVAPIKTINLHSASYALKHSAENLKSTYPSGTPLGPDYVANGSLIAAAIHAGFTYKTFIDDLGYPDINVAFNMSQTSLDDAHYRFLGSRGLTEERKRRAARRLIVHSEPLKIGLKSI